MSEIKLNVRALAGMKKISIANLAELAGINSDHLKQVASGRVTMTADDLLRLSNVTGIDPFMINTSKEQ